MRDALVPLVGRRLQVTGTFTKYGSRLYFRDFRDFRELTLLLEDLRLPDDTPLTDHQWFPVGVRFGALDLRAGDVVTFTARVRPYRKYNVYRRRNGKVKSVTSTMDYCLAYPTRCVVLSHAPKPAPAPVIPAVEVSSVVETVHHGLHEEPTTCEHVSCVIHETPPALPARTRILAALAPLCQDAEPPSLKHLFAHANMAPASFLAHLHKLAKTGAVCFQPDGRVFMPAPMPATTERSI